MIKTITGINELSTSNFDGTWKDLFNQTPAGQTVIYQVAYAAATQLQLPVSNRRCTLIVNKINDGYGSALYIPLYNNGQMYRAFKATDDYSADWSNWEPITNWDNFPLGFTTEDEIYNWIWNKPNGIYNFYCSSATVQLLNCAPPVYTTAGTAFLEINISSLHVILNVTYYGAIETVHFYKSYFRQADQGKAWSVAGCLRPKTTITYQEVIDTISKYVNCNYSMALVETQAVVLGLPSKLFSLSINATNGSAVITATTLDSLNPQVYKAVYTSAGLSAWKEVVFS